MTIKAIEDRLKKLFQENFFEKAESIRRIKGGVSDRTVYKISSRNYVCIGVHNEKLRENKAFIEFSKSLKKCGIKVPEIYSVSEDGEYYTEEFAGDKSLYDIVKDKKVTKEEKMRLYRKSLSDLAIIQTRGSEAINYRHCYETREFSRRQIYFDFNKFNNYYLRKLTGLKFTDRRIRKIRNEIYRELKKEKRLFFMYRDFQPRNIMLKEGALHYIDYQSGRKGPMQYDAASFLFSGSIELEEDTRDKLLNFYIGEISKQVKISTKRYRASFYYFALIRLLQILGSYGFLYEKKKDRSVFKKMDKARRNIAEIKKKLRNSIIRDFAEEISNNKSKFTHI